MSNLAQAEARFHKSQEALKAFIQEHMEYTITGLEFVNVAERDREKLALELDRLRLEHEVSGREWANLLPIMV